MSTKTKIAIMTDCHIGHPGMGLAFCNQPVWVRGESELFRRLASWAGEQRLDLLINAGDATHESRPEEISLALELLSTLPARLQKGLVLGNHDLMRADSYPLWLAEAAAHSQIVLADAVIELEDCSVFLLNNRWWHPDREADFHWIYRDDKDRPIGTLTEAQLDWLDDQLGTRTQQPAIVVSHFPLHFWPADVVNLTAKWNAVLAGEARRLASILNAHAHVRLHCTGHNHQTRATFGGGAVQLTTSAFNEVPFGVRLIEVDPVEIRVSMAYLHRWGDPVEWQSESAFAQGQPSDREFVINAR